MSWVKVDDKAWSHPKFAGLSGNAVRLWLFALCWCNQQETDGKIPRGVLRVLGGTQRDTKELVAAGLWIATDEGWEVHDFLVYQPSKAKRDAERAKIRARVERHRTGVTKGGSNARGTDDVTPLHVPKKRKRNDAPDPDPDPVNDPGGGRSKDLPGSAPVADTSKPPPRAERFTVRGRNSEGKPIPRHDPLGERFGWSEWFPWQDLLDWARERGLSGEDVDATLIEARDKLTGLHDVSWWDLKVVRFFEVAIERNSKADPEHAPRGVDPRVEAARLAAERRREESRRRAREALLGAQATLGAPPPQKRVTGAATAEQSLFSVAAADQGVES